MYSVRRVYEILIIPATPHVGACYYEVRRSDNTEVLLGIPMHSLSTFRWIASLDGEIVLQPDEPNLEIVGSHPVNWVMLQRENRETSLGPEQRMIAIEKAGSITTTTHLYTENDGWVPALGHVDYIEPLRPDNWYEEDLDSNDTYDDDGSWEWRDV